MRAIYLESEKLDQSTVMLEGEKLHHLLNVVRIKKGQDILLLNGLGSKAFGKIESISKKNVQIVIEKLEQSKHPGNISVAFALPKKDALETALRSCVESGARNIYILNSE
ncbi:MAG: RsmE family RNA methyltransferase, partial [Bacteriovoracaceae bacterium]|nr:RsmE family RNA methyltransferase [Bacteriovoracaceae bacterium]